MQDIWIVEGHAASLVCTSKEIAEAWGLVIEQDEKRGEPARVWKSVLVDQRPDFINAAKLGFRF